MKRYKQTYGKLKPKLSAILTKIRSRTYEKRMAKNIKALLRESGGGEGLDVKKLTKGLKISENLCRAIYVKRRLAEGLRVKV